MSLPLQVRIARAGKEVGSYDSAEALRLLGLGTLKPTDHYWHLGMGGWELLSKLDESEAKRLITEAQQKLDALKAEKLSIAGDEERLRQKVEEAVRARLAEERAKGAPSKDADDNNLGCFGGVLFAGGVVGVLGAYGARNNEQRSSDGLTFLSGSRRYTPIDSSGYDAFAFVAGAVALLGLGLIIAGLSRKK
jgi:hypothetical protein